MRWRKLIKDNQKNFSRLHMLIDVFVIAASYAAGVVDPFQGIFEHSAVQSKTVQEYMFMLIFIIPGYVLLYQAFDLYTPMRMQGRRLVLAGIVKANALGLLIIMFALYNFKEAGLFPSYSGFFLCDQYRPGMVCAYGHILHSPGYAEERNEPETGAAGRIQPCCRGICRQDPAESAMGIRDQGHTG